jgi:hypothetical protein
LLTHLRFSFALSVVLTAGAVAVSAQAFTAGSDVGGSRAGSGSAAISGYAVTNVDYSFVSAGATISGVTFDLDRPADSARVAFGGAVWNSCTVATTADAAGKYAATCQGLDVPVASANELSVVAQQA